MISLTLRRHETRTHGGCRVKCDPRVILFWNVWKAVFFIIIYPGGKISLKLFHVLKHFSTKFQHFRKISV